MKEISIPAWDEIDISQVLSTELPLLSFVVLRTFSRVTFDDVDTDGNGKEINSLEVFRSTGTDRRDNANVWNVEHFDHEHDLEPTETHPQDLIYGFLIDLTVRPCLYTLADGKDSWTWQPINEIIDPLSENDAIAVYDNQLLEKVSPYEYWFKGAPLDAALLLIVPELAQ